MSFWQGRGRPSAYCAQCRKGNPRYGTAHKKRRADGLRYAWGQPCTRCGIPLVEGEEVHLDHVDGGGPDDYAGWAHAYCNEAAAARRGNQLRGMRRHPERWAAVPVPASMPDMEHREPCRCRESYRQFGVWPARCW
jgi:hypothetical protein